MPATYEPIATTTLGSAQSTITFSSIPATYTDLRLTLVPTTSAGAVNILMRFNGDSATNYSYTDLSGTGTVASANRFANATAIYFVYDGPSSTIPTFYTQDIFSYAGSTNKTMLCTASEDKNGSGAVRRAVSLWRSTSAITSLVLSLTSGNFNTGTTATLYGILKA